MHHTIKALFIAAEITLFGFNTNFYYLFFIITLEIRHTSSSQSCAHYFS